MAGRPRTAAGPSARAVNAVGPLGRGVSWEGAAEDRSERTRMYVSEARRRQRPQGASRPSGQSL